MAAAAFAFSKTSRAGCGPDLCRGAPFLPCNLAAIRNHRHHYSTFATLQAEIPVGEASSILVDPLLTEAAAAAAPAAGVPATEFAPVLNVPALCSFVVIMAIFGFLQYRVAMIGQAADDRTVALEELRELKSKELAGEATPEQVERALGAYREAYERVEELRVVIPGIARIVPPPTQSVPEGAMEENRAAAKQFLGIEDEFASPPETQRSSSGTAEDEEAQGLSPVLTSILAIVAASQILLLGFLAMDPMSANNILDTTDILDTISSGLE